MKATLKQLEHAAILRATGNFTRAASQANLSQSAFSRSIDKLEAIFGETLFNRDGRTITPTIFGEAVTRGAQELQDRYEEIHREVHNLRGLATGSLAVAFGVYPAEIVGHKAIADLNQQYPELLVRSHVCNWEDVNQMVIAKEVDLAYAVLNEARRDERLAIEQVAQHEKALYASADHPLAHTTHVSREQLDAYPLVSIRVPAGLAPLIPGKAELDESTGFLLPAVEIDNFNLARGIIAGTHAIGVTAPIQIESQLSSGQLVLLDYPRPWIAPEYGFIYRKHRSLSPAAREFMNLIREHESQAMARNTQLLDEYLPMR